MADEHIFSVARTAAMHPADGVCAINDARAPATRAASFLVSGPDQTRRLLAAARNAARSGDPSSGNPSSGCPAWSNRGNPPLPEHAAASSPREWPKTAPGTTPLDRNNASSAASTAKSAGWAKCAVSTSPS